MISHFQHLEREEGEPFGLALVIRGAQERLSPIMMTVLATALALVPLVIYGSRPGQEIENPMAIVILGGLATSTLLNLFVVPALYLRFGRSTGRERSESALMNSRRLGVELNGNDRFGRPRAPTRDRSRTAAGHRAAGSQSVEQQARRRGRRLVQRTRQRSGH